MTEGGSQNARPFLKWVGGKSQVLPELIARVPSTFGTYHEPFVGGGALFFELVARGEITAAVLSDINQALIDVYLGLRDCVNEVIEILKQHYYDKDYYYYIRALNPQTMSLSERAARLIYLNKTCFNGLYRENRAGQFNVPFGRHKNPTICDEPNLRAVSDVLQGVRIESRHFSSILEVAQAGDFVYFDPPYHPLSTTSNFTSYSRYGFAEQDQIQLKETFASLAERGVMAMLSNSDTPFIQNLYADYKPSTVYAARTVNSKGDSRGKIAEVIICNYSCSDEEATASARQLRLPNPKSSAQGLINEANKSQPMAVHKRALHCVPKTQPAHPVAS